MSQAKTLNDKELKIVLATIAQNRHAERNRAIVMMSFLAGLRACEMAALRVSDVVAADGNIKEQINLLPDQKKGKKHRTIVLGEKLRRELATYAKSLKHLDGNHPFFYSQRNRR